MLTPLKNLARMSNVEPADGTAGTATAGMFYHGAPAHDLADLRSQFDLTGAGRSGIYFTQSPTYATVYALTKGMNSGTRIFRAEICAKNPFITPSGFCLGEVDSHFEQEMCDFAQSEGHDCIVSKEPDGLVWEIAVFDRSIVKFRSTMGAVSAAAIRGLKEGLFYSSQNLSAPEFSEECAIVFGDRARAAEFTPHDTIVAAGVDERLSIFCDQTTWPFLDRSFLEEQHVDVVIDPDTGDALVFDRDKALPLNRQLRRRYVAKRRVRASIRKPGGI